MISLFIDTCTSNVIIALFKDKKVIRKIVQKNDNNLSNVFTPLVANILKESSIEVKDIEKVFVAVGPGSFTGIRVGLTFVKVLAYSLKIPVVPVSSLEVLASGMDSDVLVPMLNARRGYVYTGIYDKDLNLITEDKYIYLESLQNSILESKNPVFISCDEFEFATETPKYQLEKVIEKHYEDTGVNPHSLVPSYLKRTEAEEKLGVN